ncbi:hypothetical protein B0H10DRAFT_213240 [Mycena sp. CBHHK59/15]|nr:hypothetical protein B0H10DRAFT_213240 [Mycena sp. CBHHK59/15]
MSPIVRTYITVYYTHNGDGFHDLDTDQTSDSGLRHVDDSHSPAGEPTTLRPPSDPRLACDADNDPQKRREIHVLDTVLLPPERFTDSKTPAPVCVPLILLFCFVFVLKHFFAI